MAKLSFLITALFLFSLVVFGQTQQKETVTQTPPPGNMKLLPGYTHSVLPTLDSHPGYISKKDGVTIYYDIGVTGGRGISKDEEVVRRVSQILSGREVVIIQTKKKIYITFPTLYANFWAEIKTESDVTEVLLMVLTYEDKPTSEKKN